MTGTIPITMTDLKPGPMITFLSKHREETRGIGGIFFDYLKPSDTLSKQDLFAFVQDVGNAFAPAYTHFMHQNRDIPFGEAEKQWQFLRRGPVRRI